MSNLLPQKEREALQNEYNVRVIVVALTLVSTSIFIGAILLLPSFFLTQSQTESIKRQASVLEESISSRTQDNIEKEISATQEKLSILSPKDNQLSGIIRDIIDTKSKNISLSSFFFESNGLNTALLTIRGVALTRDNLVSFSRDLQHNSMLSNVSLPVSDLAANRNITFSMIMNVIVSP